MGFTQRQIVLAYYAWCVIFGPAALGLENRLYKLIAMIVLFGVHRSVGALTGPATSPGAITRGKPWMR